MSSDTPRNGRIAFQQGWKKIACPFPKTEQPKRDRWLREWDAACQEAWDGHLKSCEQFGKEQGK